MHFRAKCQKTDPPKLLPYYGVSVFIHFALKCFYNLKEKKNLNIPNEYFTGKMWGKLVEISFLALVGLKKNKKNWVIK